MNMMKLILISILLISSLSAKESDENSQIATATQRGDFIYVYNSKGSQLCTLSAGDGLTGYTQSSVSIRRGDFIYTFDSKGRQNSVIAAGK
jgi:hypothetical protein